MNKKNWILLGLVTAVLFGFVFSFSRFNKESVYINPPVISDGNPQYATTTNTATSGAAVAPTPAAPPKFLAYGNVTVRTGERAQFTHLSIEPLRAFDESRCPTGVTCIWAGTLKAEVRIVSGMGTSTQIVELGNSISTKNETITFVAATPYPKEGKSITEGEYQLTFGVVRRPSGAAVPPPPPPTPAACYTGGCSSEVCSDSPDVASNCMFRPEFACYKNTKCERQASGQCGWTETALLRACLSNPPGGAE